MSALARENAKFKAGLLRQNPTSWHSTGTASTSSTAPSTPAPVKPEPDSSSGSKKKQKSNIVYSQPADTGTGTNVNTQLVYALDHLRSREGPMSVRELSLLTETPVDSDPVLFAKFKSHDRVHFDPKTNLYSYKHDFNFRNKPALLTEIQRHTRRGGGIPVRSLKESWKEAPAAIEELEKEGDVLVTRTAKDGTLKMVFYNEIKPNEDSGGVPVEQEFRDIWHSLKVPTDADLLRELAAEGLQVTAAQGAAPQKAQTKGKKKRSAPRQRQVRVTNNHLGIDLSQDYVPPTKSNSGS
ncbi:hypothetical protein DL96DRAFT_805605 [Flagelloscypha sp. PMI_526]|nr:hypothetical protein DL96DRAFT_805605 [Flagelloscypha sp. PMI_526]